MFLKNRNLAAALILFALSLVGLIGWHIANSVPTGHDSLVHAQVAIQFAQAASYTSSLFMKIFDMMPARYMPLTYGLTGVIHLITGYSSWSYGLTTIFFYMVSCLGLILIGFHVSKGRFFSILPFALFLSIPAVWEVFTSYNLEAGLLAGVISVLAILILADKIDTKAKITASLLVVFVFAFSKTVLFIPVFPAAILLCFTSDQKIRKFRIVVTFVLLFAALLWIAPRLSHVFPEISVDFNYDDTGGRGSFYYLKLLLWGYRGIFLIIGFFILLVIRWKKDSWKINDAAFALFFLVPFFFFSSFDVKRDWYILAGSLSLPVWVCFSGTRIWENHFPRIVLKILTAIYTLLALVSIGALFFGLLPGNYNKDPIADILPPAPPTQTEQELTNFLLEEFAQNPWKRIAMDLSPSDILVNRATMMLIYRQPLLVFNMPITFTDRLGNTQEKWVNSVENATHVFTFENHWPSIDKLSDIQSNFQKQQHIVLPGGEQIYVWANTNPQVRYGKGKLLGIAAFDEGRKAYQRGDFLQAADIYSRLIFHNKKYHEARFWLAKSLTAAGKFDQAKEHWDRLFEADTTFGTKVESLRALAELESEQKSPPGIFKQYFAPLLKSCAKDKREMYSLLSTDVFAMQLQKNWQGALVASKKLREHLKNEQVPGVNLSEALLHKELGQFAQAISLLKKNLAQCEDSDPVYAESAVHLALIYSEAGKYQETETFLQKAIKAKADPDFLANSAITISKKLFKKGKDEKAFSVLNLVAAKSNGEAASRIQIEIGNRFKVKNEKQKAIAAYKKAIETTSDENIKQWLKETINEM